MWTLWTPQHEVLKKKKSFLNNSKLKSQQLQYVLWGLQNMIEENKTTRDLMTAGKSPLSRLRSSQSSDRLLIQTLGSQGFFFSSHNICYVSDRTITEDGDLLCKLIQSMQCFHRWRYVRFSPTYDLEQVCSPQASPLQPNSFIRTLLT